MKKEELERMDVGELLELAVKKKIPIREDMEKAELVEAIHSVLGAGTGGQAPSTSEEGERPVPEAQAPDMQQAVEESKYYTGQPAEEPAPAMPSELPYEYGDDRIALLVRDPYWAYAYWEVTPGRIESGKAEMGEAGRGAHLALRVYDVTDIPFDGTNARGFHDIGIYERIGDWYINTNSPGRSFVVDLGLKAPDGRFITLARSNAISTPLDRASEVLDEEWVMAEEAYRRLFALSGGYTIGLSSAELAAAGGQRIQFGVASPGMGSMALMSPGMRGKKERGFWFVLNTELIVYGATEPDAAVTVQGRPIQLRPDGTFSLRFALPDGAQAIPVSATSADRIETRWITPQVTRKTESAIEKEEAA